MRYTTFAIFALLAIVVSGKKNQNSPGPEDVVKYGFRPDEGTKNRLDKPKKEDKKGGKNRWDPDDEASKNRFDPPKKEHKDKSDPDDEASKNRFDPPKKEHKDKSDPDDEASKNRYDQTEKSHCWTVTDDANCGVCETTYCCEDKKCDSPKYKAATFCKGGCAKWKGGCEVTYKWINNDLVVSNKDCRSSDEDGTNRFDPKKKYCWDVEEDTGCGDCIVTYCCHDTKCDKSKYKASWKCSGGCTKREGGCLVTYEWDRRMNGDLEETDVSCTHKSKPDWWSDSYDFETNRFNDREDEYMMEATHIKNTGTDMCLSWKRNSYSNVDIGDELIQVECDKDDRTQKFDLEYVTGDDDEYFYLKPYRDADLCAKAVSTNKYLRSGSKSKKSKSSLDEIELSSCTFDPRKFFRHDKNGNNEIQLMDKDDRHCLEPKTSYEDAPIEVNSCENTSWQSFVFVKPSRSSRASRKSGHKSWSD